eukprot:755440-Hanusia_phi.AAC.1
MRSSLSWTIVHAMRTALRHSLGEQLAQCLSVVRTVSIVSFREGESADHDPADRCVNDDFEIQST